MGWRLEITNKDGDVISEGGSGGCLYTNLDGTIYTIPLKDDEMREEEYDDFGWEKFSLEILNRVDKKISNSILGHNAPIVEALLKHKEDKDEFWNQFEPDKRYEFDYINFLSTHEILDEVWVHVC